MKPLRPLAACLVASALAAAPAEAVGMPSVDLPVGHVAVQGGISGVFFIVPMVLGVAEWAPVDRLVLGAGASGWMGWGFATWRLARLPGGAALGLMAAGGFNDERAIFGTLGPPLASPPFTGPAPDYYYGTRIFRGPWAQAALAAAWPVGPVTLRATLGPVAGQEAVFVGAMQPGESAVPLDMRPAVVLVPNVELGFKIAEGHEITLGGYGWIGWRGRF